MMPLISLDDARFVLYISAARHGFFGFCSENGFLIDSVSSDDAVNQFRCSICSLEKRSQTRIIWVLLKERILVHSVSSDESV